MICMHLHNYSTLAPESVNSIYISCLSVNLAACPVALILTMTWLLSHFCTADQSV